MEPAQPQPLVAGEKPGVDLAGGGGQVVARVKIFRHQGHAIVRPVLIVGPGKTLTWFLVAAHRPEFPTPDHGPGERHRPDLHRNFPAVHEAPVEWFARPDDDHLGRRFEVHQVGGHPQVTPGRVSQVLVGELHWHLLRRQPQLPGRLDLISPLGDDNADGAPVPVNQGNDFNGVRGFIEEPGHRILRATVTGRPRPGRQSRKAE